MAATSFWRKSARWWGMCLAMICTGTGSALTYADAGRGVSLGLSVLAFGMAAGCAAMVVRVWVLHRRTRAAP